MKIPGYYELKDKLNRQKKKFEQDSSKLQFKIKKQNELIEALKTRNKGLKSREMYQTWLKEREKLIAQIKENNRLIDEVVALKKKLTDEIKTSTKSRKEKLRLWCTKCDVDMVDKGFALDCPEDGTFYICPTCNRRIVVFNNGVD